MILCFQIKLFMVHVPYQVFSIGTLSKTISFRCLIVKQNFILLPEDALPHFAFRDWHAARR